MTSDGRCGVEQIEERLVKDGNTGLRYTEHSVIEAKRNATE